MINIPTELLRTLVAVVDHKSFTKAAQSLGVTQPAVSAQIKRLQTLLGTEVFDKNIAAVALTPAGEAVVTYARRLLSINDQIFQLAAAPAVRRPLRMGVTGDYFSPYLPRAFANFRKRWPFRKFEIIGGTNTKHLHDLRTGELDLILLLTADKPERDSYHHWTEEMVWARGAASADLAVDPVPIVTRGEHWMNHQMGVAALEKAGRKYEVTFIGPSILGLIAAARAGLGVIPAVRRRMVSTDLILCPDELPRIPDAVCSIYISETGDAAMLKDLAEEVVAGIRGPNLPADLAQPPRALPFRTDVMGGRE
jgi:DNA-binding transcriptional LysR family regulator